MDIHKLERLLLQPFKDEQLEYDNIINTKTRKVIVMGPEPRLIAQDIQKHLTAISLDILEKEGLLIELPSSSSDYPDIACYPTDKDGNVTGKPIALDLKSTLLSEKDCSYNATLGSCFKLTVMGRGGKCAFGDYFCEHIAIIVYFHLTKKISDIKRYIYTVDDMDEIEASYEIDAIKIKRLQDVLGPGLGSGSTTNLETFVVGHPDDVDELPGPFSSWEWVQVQEYIENMFIKEGKKKVKQYASLDAWKKFNVGKGDWNDKKEELYLDAKGKMKAITAAKHKRALEHKKLLAKLAAEEENNADNDI